MSPERYYVPDDDAPEFITVNTVPLVNGVGDVLTDADGNQLFGSTQAPDFSQAFSTTPATDKVVEVRAVGSQISEVAFNLLGIERTIGRQAQIERVNSYGLDPSAFDADTNYTYEFDDPASHWSIEPAGTYTGAFGLRVRHRPAESAVQCYAYPPPTSFPWPTQAIAPYWPSLRTDGVMVATLTGQRLVRYQPGRITGFTLGISTLGDVIQSPTALSTLRWGIESLAGDKFYFEYVNGRDLYIVKERPGYAAVRVSQDDWNLDPLLGGDLTPTQWLLDPRRVTMYAIEFGWYGAIGANFLVYVPDGHREHRWVRLHAMEWLADSFGVNDFSTPSLASPVFRLFTRVEAKAGVTSPQGINLYGSSAYIDGGDRGGSQIYSASAFEHAIETGHQRSLLGLRARATISNNDGVAINNFKALTPATLSVNSSVDATIRLALKRHPFTALDQAPITYGYGAGLTLQPADTSFTVAYTRDPNADDILLGNFSALAGTTTFDKPFGPKLSFPDAYVKALIVSNGNVVGVQVQRNLARNANVNASFYVTDIPESGTVTVNPYDAVFLSNETLPAGTIALYERSNDVRIGWIDASVPFALGSVTWLRHDSTSLRYALSASGPPQVFTESENKFRVGDYYSSYTAGVAHNLVVHCRAKGASIVDLQAHYLSNGAPTAIAPTWTEQTNNGSTLTNNYTYVPTVFRVPDDTLSGALIDTLGTMRIVPDEALATYFVKANQTLSLDLSTIFDFDRTVLRAKFGTSNLDPGALFVLAEADTQTGTASATLTWREF